MSISRNMNGRHEIKHFISYSDFIQLRSRLPYVLKPDMNANDDNTYRVRSLYFDNYNDKALREKKDGVDEREKFRLRLYNDDPSLIKLEKKSKKNGLCYKQSAVISMEHCKKLLNGEYEVLKQDGHPLMLELYTKLNSQLLRPKSIVDYKREAYVYPAGNVRVTLDYDIRAGTDTGAFLDQEIITVPIQDKIILEVKYDRFIPEIVRGVIALSNRQQTSFSKYAAARFV
ncbi:MAG TPA: polyphosphate polymerase domain-containing protein [Thermoclostridium sp.]